MRSSVKYFQIFKQVAVLTAISLVAGTLANAFGPRSIPWIRDNLAEVSRPLRAADIEPLSTRVALERWREGSAVFVDAREPEDFASGHIPGALNVSLDPLGDDILTQAKRLPKDRLLVIYCSSITCPLSKELAMNLKSLGFLKLAVAVEGYDGWVKAGGQVEGKS